MGPLALAVADLSRSLAFYTRAIGLEVQEQDASGATLGAAGRPLLVLTEQAGASAWPRDTRDGYTGLYHFAILVPTRADLGRWLRNWLELGLRLPGQGDHLVSEALYVEDPDGNGIEVYRDRSRDEWPRVNGQIQMASDPVDIRGLLEEAVQSDRPWTGLPAGTIVGHVHLQVGNIPRAAEFYHGVVGFDIIASMPSALFISAGGYHHHLGLNTWHSLDAGPAPDGFAGLRWFTIELPTEEAREAVLQRLDAAGVPHTEENGDTVLHDPWQNRIVLRAGA
jgi:catechol 2,3-dioxygenase